MFNVINRTNELINMQREARMVKYGKWGTLQLGCYRKQGSYWWDYNHVCGFIGIGSFAVCGKSVTVGLVQLVCLILKR